MLPWRPAGALEAFGGFEGGPNAPAGLQGNNSYSYMPLPSVFQGVQDCRLPALKPPKRFQRSRRPPRQQLLQLHVPKPSKRFQPSRRPPRPCHLFFRGSRLPFARPQTPQTLPTLPQASKATTLTATCPQTLQTLPTLSQASKATTLTATCPCHLFFRGFKTAFARPQTPQTLPTLSQASKATTLTATCPTLPQASEATTLTATCPCHLFFRGFKTAVCRPQTPKRFQPSRRPPRQQLLQLHAPAICFSGGSRLPFARPQTPQTLPTLPQASKATTLTATCPCHLFFRGFKTAVASTATCPCHLFFTGFKTAVCPASNPPNASSPPAGSKATTLTATCPCHLFFRGFKTAVCPPFEPREKQMAGACSCACDGSLEPPEKQMAGTCSCKSCCLGGLRERWKRLGGLRAGPTLPQASKATTLTATCPCHLFFRGSRLPSQAKAHATFARPQTLQTLPHASKATTLTATTCPCHLFFRGFKTAVCPPSNPPNASNAPAGLQGNNSYSYMPLPSVFHGVQDCRLPGLKRPKRF